MRSLPFLFSVALGQFPFLDPNRPDAPYQLKLKELVDAVYSLYPPGLELEALREEKNVFENTLVKQKLDLNYDPNCGLGMPLSEIINFRARIGITCERECWLHATLCNEEAQQAIDTQFDSCACFAQKRLLQEDLGVLYKDEYPTGCLGDEQGPSQLIYFNDQIKTETGCQAPAKHPRVPKECMCVPPEGPWP